MTISKDLYLAILAVDAYNQGYGVGINHGKTQIGSATKQSESNISANSDEVAASFYAVAYTMGSGPDVPQELQGKTIISNRGTDFTPETDFAIDQTEGWPLGAGNFLHEQTRLAKEFLYAVQPDDGLKSVILTGHSLGGGLAVHP